MLTGHRLDDGGRQPESAAPDGPGDPSLPLWEHRTVGNRASSSQLVGREGELASLLDLLRSIPDGGSPVVTVLVGGEAGIGKSRLIEEFCSRARADGVLVATGGCAPVDGGGLPYGPVVGILRDLVRQLDLDTVIGVLGPAIDGLGVHVPGHDGAGGFHPSTEPASPVALDKTRLFAALLTSVAALADSVPTVLVFEDLHWADSASAELFDFLTRNLRHSPVLLVGTYRDDELGDQHPLRGPLTELGRHPHVVELHLAGLDRGDTAALLRAILGREPDDALVGTVHRRSEGNPFFVEELTAASTSPGLPEELRKLILLRVEHLGTGAQRLLAAAATVGAHVDHRLLATVTHGDGDTFDEALAEVMDQRILVVDPEGNGYRFRHTLLHEAVSGALIPAERARLHGRVASALETHPEFSAAGPGHAATELAGHWWAAGEWPEALGASLEAGEAAATVFAFAEAQLQFERALDAWDRVPDAAARLGRDRASVLEAAADAAYLGGNGERAVELAGAAVAEIDSAADPVRMAVGLTSLSRNNWSIGESKASLEALEQALAILPTEAPSVELARILAEKCRGLMLMSRFHEAEACSAQAIDIARAVGARAEEGQATNTLGVVRAHLGDVDEGIALLRRALEIAEELVDPDSLNRGYSNLSHLLFLSGRLEDAAAVTLDGLASGEVLGGIRLNAAALNSSFALLRLGRWDEATALVVEADTVSGNCTMSVDLLLSEVALRRGQFDDAARALVRLDNRSRSLEDVQFRGEFHTLRAALTLELGRPGDAFEDVERALALAAATDDRIYTPQMCLVGIQALADRAEQDRTGGRRSDGDGEGLPRMAAAMAKEAERIAAPLGPEGSPIPLVRASAMQCRAEESRVVASDPALWDQSARYWEELSYAFQVAYCRWRQAEALLNGSRQRSAASSSLRTAWAIADQLGARPLRDRIERLAQRARIDLVSTQEGAARSPVASELGLTPREVEVLSLLSKGRTDGQIAEELFISKKTASVHVSNLLRKLDVASRIEAGAIGQGLGLG